MLVFLCFKGGAVEWLRFQVKPCMSGGGEGGRNGRAGDVYLCCCCIGVAAFMFRIRHDLVNRSLREFKGAIA
jgi:hypothetical protein